MAEGGFPLQVGGRHVSPLIIAAGFRGGIRQKRRPRLLVEYHWALAGMYGSSVDSGLMFQYKYADEKRAGTTVRFVIWADRERTADLAVSHAVTCQLRSGPRSDQGECLNDYKPGLQDGGACGQFGDPGDVFTN